MVTTRFIGRLGNSMFQTAACIGYAKKYNYAWAVPYNSNESSIHKVFPSLPKTYDNPITWPRRGRGYDASMYDYINIPHCGPNVMLAGFFQSYKYFEHCENEVRKVFKLDYYPEYKYCVSIHVRRGDYVNLVDNFDPVTPEYIHRAMQYFLDRDRIRKFVVFSDDIEWCKQNINIHVNVADDKVKEYQDILSKMIEFSEGRSEREDLSMMHSCRDHIISNSTFSWWSAWLSPYTDKTVVCPHNLSWYGKNNGVVVSARQRGTEPAKDLIPPDWIKIKFR